MIQLLDTTSSRHVFLDAARGIHPDCQTVHLFGFNRTVGITYETIANDGGGIYAFPASAVQMSLVSASAADTMSVMLTGLDTNRDIITETIELDGQTPVTTAKSFLRINDARIASGNNAGNITISNGGTTYAFIEATYGVHQAAVYSVPRNYALYITQVSITSGTINSNKYGFLRARLSNSSTIIHFFESTFVTSQLTYSLQVPFTIPASYDFTMEAKSSSSENEFTAYIGGLLVADPA